MSDGEIILYNTEDGQARIRLRSADGSVWLSQAEMAELFQTTSQNVTQHIRTIYEDGELNPEGTCKDFLQVRTEGDRPRRQPLGGGRAQHRKASEAARVMRATS